MTYKLPEPISRDDTEHNKDYYTAETTQAIADAAYAAGQRDMLDRAIAIAEPRSCEVADLLKDLLNEQH